MTRHPDEFSWLTDTMPEGPDRDATDRARIALIAHLKAAAPELAVAPRRGRGRRGRLLRRPLTPSLLTIGAAAAAAIALIVGGGDGHAGHVPSTGPTRALNASAVVRRVSARVKELGASYGVAEGIGADGRATSWFYTDPHTGVQYERDVYGPSVTYATSYWGRQRLLAPRRAQITQLWVDARNRTWWIKRSVIGVHPSTVPNIFDSAQQIDQFLHRRDIHLAGQRRVRGQQALELTVGRRPQKLSLYVSATSYRPIEEVITSFSHGRMTDVDRSYLVSATAANIAHAKDRPGHAGYRQIHRG
jgi:hypothetical protein